MRSCSRCQQPGHNKATCAVEIGSLPGRTPELVARSTNGLVKHNKETLYAFRYYSHPVEQPCEFCEEEQRA